MTIVTILALLFGAKIQIHKGPILFLLSLEFDYFVVSLKTPSHFGDPIYKWEKSLVFIWIIWDLTENLMQTKRG